MYSVIFETDNGKKYVFGRNGNTIFDMDVGNGLSVAINTSQGFLQIGETVETRSLSGRKIKARGAVFGDVPKLKNAMRSIITPFASGRLIFEEKYFIRVFVKDAPTFSPVKNNGKFTMQFFAPYPFFSSMEEKMVRIGEVQPQFRFPVNYGEPHRFGTRDTAKYTNISNGGDVRVPFHLLLRSDGECPNVTISNLDTLAYLKINGTLSAGESMDIYRDNDGVLRAELITDDGVSDAISWIDEDSTLFELAAGDNLISATDDNGGANLTASFTYREAVAALYES